MSQPPYKYITSHMIPSSLSGVSLFNTFVKGSSVDHQRRRDYADDSTQDVSRKYTIFNHGLRSELTESSDTGSNDEKGCVFSSRCIHLP